MAGVHYTSNVVGTNIYDICVVGAGLWGSAAAYHLSLNSDCRVCLIGPNEPSIQDYSNRTIFGSHYDETRITRLNLGSCAEAQIARKSMEASRELTTKTGISFYTECSNVNFGPQGSQYIADSKRTSEHHELNHLLWRSDQVSELFPCLRIADGNHCVVQLTNCGVLNPRKQVLAQKTAAQMQGCLIVNDIVEDIKEIPNYQVPFQRPETSKILELRTEAGQIFQSKRVLLCTGGFTQFKRILPAGVELDVQLVPIQTLRLELSRDDEHRLRNMPTVCSMTRDDNQADCYICPPTVYPDGKYYLKIGHGRLRYLEGQQDATDWCQSNGDPKVTSMLREMINNYVPGLKPLSAHTDTCIGTATQSGRPYVDMITPEIGVAVGGNGVGARLAWEIGKIAAKMVTKGHWDYDLNAELFKVQLKKENCKL